MKPLAKDADLTPITQPTTRTGVAMHPLSELNQRAHWQIGDKVSKDIDIAHMRRWPGRPMNPASRLWLLIVSPGLRIILIHRLAHWLYLSHKNGGKLKWLWRVMLIPTGLLKLTMMKISTKSDISKDCEIEGGVCFSDQGNIIFGAKKAGAGTVIGTRVTVGMNRTGMGRPEIGRNVWIGSDCVVFGAITIGDGATLLPGTVLSKSIPPGVVMQGNFPRLVLRNFDNTELRERQNLDVMQYMDAKRVS
jgi:serine O-acetyltransferase